MMLEQQPVDKYRLTVFKTCLFAGGQESEALVHSISRLGDSLLRQGINSLQGAHPG
jgi:hypothetical protein